MLFLSWLRNTVSLLLPSNKELVQTGWGRDTDSALSVVVKRELSVKAKLWT